MNTSSQPTTTLTKASALAPCPAWCAGSLEEHRHEAEHGGPVVHFAYFRRSLPALPVELALTVTADDPAGTLTIGVGDDPEYDIDLAEQTALAMLEAVRVARVTEVAR